MGRPCHWPDIIRSTPMKKSKNFQIIRDLLIRPEAFYKEFVSDLPQVRSFFFAYGLPLMVLGAAGRMTRELMRHISRDVEVYGDQLAGIFIVSLIGYVLSVWLGGLIISRLAKSFGSRMDADRAILLCMTAYTPYMIAQPLAAIGTGMDPLALIGLMYAVFILGKGLGPMLDTPNKHTVGFALIGFFVLFGIAHVSYLLLAGLFIAGLAPSPGP